MKQELRSLPIERTHVYSSRLAVECGCAVLGIKIQEVAAIRKKNRPALAELAARSNKVRDGRRRATGSGNLIEAAVNTPGKDNYTLRVPGSPTPTGCVTDDLCAAAREISPEKLPRNKETDRSAVGRPERHRCTLSIFEGLCGQGIERPQPQQFLTGRIFGRENELLSVGRENWSSSNSVKYKRRSFGRENIGTDGLDRDRIRSKVGKDRDDRSEERN